MDDHVARIDQHPVAVRQALDLGFAQAVLLEQAQQVVGQGAHLIACDERGRTYGSRAFSDHIAALRDQGERRLVFAIGGADGLDRSVLDAARSTLAFGPQTWPHALARAMLAEQVYRAVTIMAGSPYHRD